ncbi:MAG: hypothetical protein LHV69_03520 [Elusimicrobia bacterium]|nr:hypothetical protein [Candidatus Obscuribacterium magneticum]
MKKARHSGESRNPVFKHFFKIRFTTWIPAFAGMTALLLSSFAFAADPALPETFDTTYSLPTGGKTWAVNAGDDLQAAIDNSSLGDVIVLQAGATFTGSYKLPSKQGTGWIYVISSELDQLPEGVRVKPEDSVHMPKIVTPGTDPALFSVFDAHNYRFAGIEFRVDGPNYNLILLGWGLPKYTDAIWRMIVADSVDKQPHHLTFDRCYLHSTSMTDWTRTGINADGRTIAIIDSRLENFKDGSDSQAIQIWNGAGPFKIVNNYLESTGENIMSGGTDPAIQNLVPSDIEFRQNYVRKRPEWKSDHPQFTKQWTIKNLLELKNARRVLITGNVFENNWGQAQGGTAILLTVRNQSNTAPWSAVQDITITNNIIRHVEGVMSIMGEDYQWPSGSEQTQRILVQNNVFEDIYIGGWGSPHGFSVSSGQGLSPVLDLNIRNNLLLYSPPETGLGSLYVWFGTDVGDISAENFIFENNIVSHGNYGLAGNAMTEGVISLNAYTPGYSFRRNLVIYRPVDREYEYNHSHFAKLYPPDNFEVGEIGAVGFTNLSGGNYRLMDSSPFQNAGTDGKDLGPDFGALEAATLHTIDGNGTLSTNQPPTVFAGNDQTIVFPSAARLSASVTDDGKPGGRLIYSWRLASGPAGATFSQPASPQTEVQFTGAGVYVFRLVAFDGSLTGSDDVHVTVLSQGQAGDSIKSINFIHPNGPHQIEFKFAVNADYSVSIKIFNSQGTLVKTLGNDQFNPSAAEMVWDGTNDAGKNVAAGTYLAKIIINGQLVKTEKLAVVR